MHHVRLNRDRLGQAADLHLEVDLDAHVGAQFVIADDLGLKAGHFGGDLILAGGQIANHVVAGLIRFDRSRQSCVLIDDRDADVRQRGAGGVQHMTRDLLVQRRLCE